MKAFFKFIPFFLVGLSLITPERVQAQDVRFSQYYAAPLQLNPAMTGAFNGTWRLGMNYRTQWGAILGKAYNSYSVMADTRIPVLKDDLVGLGLTAISDNAGMGGYTASNVGVSATYMKKLSQKRRYSLGNSESFLIAGGYIGFGQRSVNWSDLTFSTQWVAENGIYDQAITTGESTNVRESRMYPDMGFGLLWYGSFGKRKSAYFGIGNFHVNRPDISLYNTSSGTTLPIENLYSRWTAHAGGEILVGGRGSAISLLPGIVAMFQGPSMEASAGLGLRYQRAKHDDFAFKLGLWSRVAGAFSDATQSTSIGPESMIFYVGMDYRGLQFAFSYDATISSLSSAIQGRGSMEFSLIYINNADNKRRQGCPTFN